MACQQGFHYFLLREETVLIHKPQYANHPPAAPRKGAAMKFRPCIDIHNGKVKQIVGSSLRDEGDTAEENFVSVMSAREYAEMFRRDGLSGGHVIMLNRKDSAFFEETKREALSALAAWPGGLQIGGGVTPENAEEYLRAGAGHVIVTSYVFREGRILRDRLEKLVRAAGKEHLVLDLSCRKKPEDGRYYVMTDRWQTFTDTEVVPELFFELSASCDEFLIHGIGAEGRGQGIDGDLVRLLGETVRSWPAGSCAPAFTYAGGIRDLGDIRRINELGDGRIDYTVGSALDLFGGALPYSSLI